MSDADPARPHLRHRLADARLYLCTDARRAPVAGARLDLDRLADFADAALAGGVDILQLRDKAHPDGPLEASQELAALAVLAEVCRAHGALLAVNDRADIALAAGADILHLGQDDLPVPTARRILGPGVLIGRSTHGAAEVDAAAVQSAVDYFCVGPCWPTPTKPGRPAPGLGLVRHAAGHSASTRSNTTPRPWFAIGGIDHDNLDQVLAAGASRIVVVRAITSAADPRRAASDLARRLRTAAESPPA